WGDPDEAKPLSEGIRSLLTQALGVSGSPEAELEADQVRLRPSALTTANREALAAIVGAGHRRVDEQDRLLRAVVKSTLDLLRRRRHRSASRGTAWRARLFARAFSAELRIRQPRRLCRDPLVGSGFGGLRTVRRHDSRTADHHTRRRAGPGPGAAVGGRTGSA